MRIALVHDYIKEYGGAERVLEALHEIWPDAPVFTTVYLPKFLGPHEDRFKNWKIKTSIAQYLPFKEKLISPLRLIAPLLFKTFDFKDFDAVLVSATGAYSSNSIICHPELVSGSNSSGKEMPKRFRHDIGKRPIHICYCHTPPRYLYGFATARDWNKSIILRSIGIIASHFLRLVDFRSAQNVDYFIANSLNIKSRIEKFYRRDAVVVYPPVDVASSMYQVLSSKYKKDTKYMLHNTSYYLAGGRIARPKHIDLIVETFAKLGLPLKVFGKTFAGALNISISKYPNIQFLGEVSDEKKLELMKNAKAYIFASEDEDFGITPVEAMSMGTPTIAYRSGGVVESVEENKTGIFFDELKVGSLTMAINKFKTLKFDKDAIVKHAQKFSKERFMKEIREFVMSKIKEK